MSSTALPANQPSIKLRRRSLDLILLTLALLALWQAVGQWTQGIAISPPLETLAYPSDLFRTPSFWDNAGATASAFLLAFAISAVIGLALGLILGLQRFAADVAEPVLAGFYTIPKVTLYPVVLLIFGLGVSAKVAFGVMHGLVPITLINAGAPSRTMPPVLLRSCRTMRLTTRQAMQTVLIPACLPDIVNGLRIGFSLSPAGRFDRGNVFVPTRSGGFCWLTDWRSIMSN